jgi:hypothetical protein
MAWRQEKGTGDIVIDGWEKGIADSPELGIANIQSANITSVPGEVSVSFATTAGNIPPNQTGVSYTGSSGGGTFTVSSTTGYYDGMAVKIASTSLGSNQVNALLVAGGGGSGGIGATGASFNASGAGSGGQVLPITGDTIGIGTYPVIVGVGGSGGNTSGTSGTDGNISSFNGHTAAGGGAGAGTGAAPDSGAYGGGGAGVTTAAYNTGATGTVANSGGNGTRLSVSNSASGGGGGAGVSGTSGSIDGGTGNATGGNGGNGVSNSTSGSAVTYGGGGAGGASTNATATQGTAGTGGGGAANANGTVNTGGGAGATASGSGTTGLSGGSGIVIISYPTGTYTATGGTITTSGGRTIHTFTATGTTNFVVSAINPQVGDVYYIGNLTSTTFKLYYDPLLHNQVGLVSNPTGTFDIPVPTTPVATATYGVNGAVTTSKDNVTFMIDNTGNIWFIPTFTETYTEGTVIAGSLQFAANTGHATSGTNADFGIAVWSGYLFSIIKTTIGYISLANFFGATTVINTYWANTWQTNLNQTSYQHQAIVGTDAALYICNGNSVASLLQVGSSFDPTNSSTYTYTTAACTLPQNDVATCLANLGGDIPLLIGAVSNNIYTWDRVILVPNSAIICADAYAWKMVATNSNVYIFSGNRGRIYITNGQQLQLYKKIPDALSGDPEPYYQWQDALYSRNKLYFTLTATNNAGTALTTMGGIWALGIDNGQTQIQLPTAGSLFNINQFSYGTYGGSCPCLFQVPFSAFLGMNPPGFGVGGIWVNSGAVGLDFPSSSPYTNYQTSIETDIIPVGTYFDPQTDQQIEYKLSKPLVAGESLKVYWRGNLTDAYTLVWTSTTTGQVSDYSQATFQKQQWVQFKITMSSTASSPSYTRFRELRIR